MSDPVSKELVAASSKPLVLAILARGENYGYAIIQEVRERSNGRLDWTEGMLYPVLHRLEEQKLIRARWVTSENGRKRKYYRLSPQGTRALENDLRMVRSQGFAIDDGEHAIGLRCVAAAIFGADGTPVAALSVSAPAARVPDSRVQELGAAVKRAADAVSAASGRQP